MKGYFERAVLNVTKFGDTDIFPFPVENHVFFDQKDKTVELLEDINSNFERRLAEYPPFNHSALVPVGYTGFRSATQLDPLWNLYFLGLVLSIGDKIEGARVPKTEQIVFSYRFNDDLASPELFDANFNWRTFMERSNDLARDHAYVVACDISEFYPRANHHRLDNALSQLQVRGDQPHKIMEFLSNFSQTNSFGLPIGGPAARILSEILLNQVDRLLLAEGVTFCRFADDYHLFTEDYETAFNSLLYLSQKLFNTQGLQLQKSKTRIASGQEFLSTSPIREDTEEAPADRGASTLKEQSQNLMRLSIRFDPYSPTAEHDYEALKKELDRVDIIGLLKAELTQEQGAHKFGKKTCCSNSLYRRTPTKLTGPPRVVQLQC